MKKISVILFLSMISSILLAQENNFVVENYDTGSLREVGQRNGEGKKVGVWLEFWSNGNIKYQISYRDNVKHGDYKTFRENGNLYGYGNYNGGKLDGWFIGYNENGEVEVKLNWENGVLVEQEILNKNAKPTGTTEEIGGKKFIWLFGELKEVKE